jgi:ABC-type uncharacterized transport system permease subunit
MTTIPVQALSGKLPPLMLVVTPLFTCLALVGASWLFQQGLKKYASASS